MSSLEGGPALVRDLLGSCPLPLTGYDRVLLGHGSGGRLSGELIARLFLPALGNDVLNRLEDQGTCRLPGLAGARLAMTTDSFVVRPIFFPGGDIGSLAVHGTVNDLAVGGAVPVFLTAAFILEEGLALDELRRIVESMKAAADHAGVTIVAGDTKVVDRGKGDQIFITTTGIGLVPDGRSLSIAAAQPGDTVIVSGTIGDHGMAIMSVREGLEFETALESDTASLHGLTETMLAACDGIRLMRDPTRGGVSSALNEAATASRIGVKLVESSLPIRESVRAACEILGLDPLYVANEGKLIAVVAPEQTDALMAAMRQHPLGRDAAVIGEITTDHRGSVVMRSVAGGTRVVPLLAGEQLPRIC
ncbi:MAG: hydrogenase expression/formation protein HypE [Vicinamibacterales bacterium]